MGVVRNRMHAKCTATRCVLKHGAQKPLQEVLVFGLAATIRPVGHVGDRPLLIIKPSHSHKSSARTYNVIFLLKKKEKKEKLNERN